MSKSPSRTITIYLPESLIQQIDAEHPNRSELVRQVLETHFGHPVTPAQVDAAIALLARVAEDAAQEGLRRTVNQTSGSGYRGAD